MSDDGVQPTRERWYVRLADFIANRWFQRALLTLLIAYAALFPISMIWDVWNSRQERDRLLNHTDHHALLKACRDLMANHPEVSMGSVENDPGIPEIIRRLGVSYIEIKPDHVHIEFHGGFDHYGVDAFAEGEENPRGGQKLIDGLWYYSGG